MRNRKLIISLLSALLLYPFSPAAEEIRFRDADCWSPEREALTLEHQRRHYGIDSVLMTDPQMIIIHYTAIRTLKDTIAYLAPAQVAPDRLNMIPGGMLNVSVHFLVDYDGTIYRSVPEQYAGRHAVGYNYTAFGIENIALGPHRLTRRQLEANARLVRYLMRKYPSIRFLIGHHEYTDTSLPHYELFRENDPEYRALAKKDPGRRFMRNLRDYLRLRYRIVLLD
jgi:N-acetylmuramoyl-L-alanine amidase